MAEIVYDHSMGDPIRKYDKIIKLETDKETQFWRWGD